MEKLWFGYYITQSVVDLRSIGHGLSIDFATSKEVFIGGFFERMKSRGKLANHTLVTMEASSWDITEDDWEKLKLIAKGNGWYHETEENHDPAN